MVDSAQSPAPRDLLGATADAIVQEASRSGAPAGESAPVVTLAETGFGQEMQVVDPEQGPPASDTLDALEDPSDETVWVADDLISLDHPSETLSP